MENVLAYIMEQLNHISVRGDDVERMCEVKKTIQQIQTAFADAKKNKEKTE